MLPSTDTSNIVGTTEYARPHGTLQTTIAQRDGFREPGTPWQANIWHCVLMRPKQLCSGERLDKAPPQYPSHACRIMRLVGCALILPAAPCGHHLQRQKSAALHLACELWCLA